VGKRLTWSCRTGAAVPGRREEADSGGEELLTTELMDAGWMSTAGREGCLLQLVAVHVWCRAAR